jgi:hypothetical protein
MVGELGGFGQCLFHLHNGIRFPESDRAEQGLQPPANRGTQIRLCFS